MQPPTGLVLLTHRPDEADDLEDAAEVPSPAGEPQRDTLPEMFRSSETFLKFRRLP